jgi:hypothetical protein
MGGAQRAEGVMMKLPAEVVDEQPRVSPAPSVEVLAGRADWREGWGNRPEFYLLLSRLPTGPEYIYEKRGELYYAEAHGVCRFYAWSGHPDQGFGGSKFPIHLKDGSAVTLHGPWSSSASAMNRAGFGPCISVAFTDDTRVWTDSRGVFFGGAVRVDFLQRYLDRCTFPSTMRTRSPGLPWGQWDGAIEFPPGSKLEIAHEVRPGRASSELSDEQSYAIGIGGCDHYEPAIRLPDGSLWRKPA